MSVAVRDAFPRRRAVKISDSLLCASSQDDPTDVGTGLRRPGTCPAELGVNCGGDPFALG